MSTPKAIRVGVYIPTDAQLLDTACVDLFAMMSKEYLSLLDMLPAHVAQAAPSVSIFYITTERTGPTIPLTAGMNVQSTHYTSHPDVQPGRLDILIIPGPDPRASFEESASDFLRSHSEIETTDILSVCTGVYVCGAAGILEGRKACGPRGLQSQLRKLYPSTSFVGEKYRWIQDGNLWSCGGVTNGNDLVAAYCRTSSRFPSPVVEIACKMAEVGDRPQLYSEGQAAFTLRFVWQMVMAWFIRRPEATD